MDERLRILKLIESEEISVEEGARRLEALTEEKEPSEPAEELVIPATPGWVQALWQVVLWSGVGLLVGGGLLVTAVYAWSISANWLICGWPIVTMGTLVVLVGWWLPRAHWLYVRTEEPDGDKVNLAFPLPLRLVSWTLRIARPFVPQLEETGADEVIMAMEEELRAGNPFVVEVDEGEDGEQVRVYFS